MSAQAGTAEVVVVVVFVVVAAAAVVPVVGGTSRMFAWDLKGVQTFARPEPRRSLEFSKPQCLSLSISRSQPVTKTLDSKDSGEAAQLEARNPVFLCRVLEDVSIRVAYSVH